MVFNIFFQIIILQKQPLVLLLPLNLKFIKPVKNPLSQRVIFVLMKGYFLF